ncbi:hypothetical protein EUGRSUZ_H03729 [Eucalyptus grandis]|uniref:Uncharacterized protein n=2 Tax=Eucalyptus grandis TaxID=71139 RepID=A0ACC3JX47_EUCGR|nr:hypothetical protein EUGRSUZ_H03729 [Eucalyptus grandis]
MDGLHTEWLEHWQDQSKHSSRASKMICWNTGNRTEIRCLADRYLFKTSKVSITKVLSKLMVLHKSGLKYNAKCLLMFQRSNLVQRQNLNQVSQATSQIAQKIWANYILPPSFWHNGKLPMMFQVLHPRLFEIGHHVQQNVLVNLTT